jgi:two-component system, NarL family, sensor histidine kinase DevS
MPKQETTPSDRLRALVEMGVALSSEQSLESLLPRVIETAVELTGARYGALGVIDRSGTGLKQFITSGIDDETRAAIGDLPRGRGILGVLIHNREALRLRDLTQDPRSVGLPPGHPPMKSFLGVPITLRGETFGNLYLTEKTGEAEFSAEDEEIARLLAGQAAVAISERVSRDGVRALLGGQELERKRLARELHDEMGQALTSILLGLKALEERVGVEPLALVRELVGSALDSVRRLAVELRPHALDDFGLQAALERLTSVVGERSGLELHLNVAARAGELPPGHETAIYRIVQEALTNVVKHAQARSVSVVVASSDSAVRAVIEDDGVGFKIGTVRENAFGLLGMRERVSILGGRFELESSPGAGTTIVAELPL